MTRSSKRPPLSQLRGRLRAHSEADDEDGLRGFAEALREDSRAGAKRLLTSCERRLHRIRVERDRLVRLFSLREELNSQGVEFVAGIDEVGVGPLAGPVVAAAVVLPRRVDLPGLDDSKKLKPAQREVLDRAIRQQALSIGIGEVEPDEIDRLNIYNASLEAMRRAVVSLAPPPEHLLVDARKIPGVAIPQTAIVHGDAVDGSIAAASIVAKVHRDAIMQRLDACHPGYGFSRHMGYPTAFHVEALRRLGATPAHRRSFGPVAAVIGTGPGVGGT